MGWTKGEFVDEAFSECAMQGYVFDVGPEAREGALRRLDAMMAQWNAVGIRLGYALPSSPSTSDIDAESGVPDSANEAVFMNLAIRIASGFGKVLSQDTRNIAKGAYDTLMSRAAYPPQQQLPNTLPQGAGNKPWRRNDSPFMPTPVDPLLGTEGSDQITFE
ncbi:MAG: packaged DNA stabilization gp4 family protein [Pseudomonadota bacterium]